MSSAFSNSNKASRPTLAEEMPAHLSRYLRMILSLLQLINVCQEGLARINEQ